MKRSMADAEIEDLAAAWIDALRRGEQAEEDEVHRSVVMLTFFYAPEVQWNFILAAMKLAGDEELGHIAAGPFEGLMGPHGDDYIDRVEAESARDPQFKEMVRDAYQHMMSEQVWSRVQAIQA
jgi:hypothetical protein